MNGSSVCPRHHEVMEMKNEKASCHRGDSRVVRCPRRRPVLESRCWFGQHFAPAVWPEGKRLQHSSGRLRWLLSPCSKSAPLRAASSHERKEAAATEPTVTPRLVGLRHE